MEERHMLLPSERTIQDIVSDFWGTAPSLEEIATYQLPDEIQARAYALLERKQRGSLTDEERREIEAFRQIDHLLLLVKAKAHLRLKAREA
jgi:hypothetical protein